MESFLTLGEGAMSFPGQRTDRGRPPPAAGRQAHAGVRVRRVWLGLTLLGLLAGLPARVGAGELRLASSNVLPDVLLGHAPVSDRTLAASAPGTSPLRVPAEGALAFPWAVLVAEGTSPVYGVRTLVLTTGYGATLEAPPWPPADR